MAAKGLIVADQPNILFHRLGPDDRRHDGDLWTSCCALVEDPAHEAESRLKTSILQAFNPDEMARENLASLYRRRLVRDVNLKQGHTWAHNVDWDQRKGTLGQYF